MAKGHRGKGQSTATANGPQNKKAAEDQHTQSVKGQRNRNRGKKEVIQNEEPKAEIVEDTPNSNHVTETTKKEPLHPKVQPTTEQLMIAKIIDHSDDPHQRKKIQQVMDVTGKPEDEVATALFDAGWDESRAVELLLEDGDHLSAWEETGKKKNKKKSATNDKDEWDDNDEGFHEGGREKSQGRKGPPRMRRGGSNAEKGGRGGKGGLDFTANGDGDQVVPSGKAPRRGDQPPRRGGRGGGNRNFSSRQQSGQPHGNSMSSNTGGFQGSIDTWNNPGEQTSSSGAEREGHRGGRSGRGGRGGRGGGPGGKDAFDNAGNWGDDFPQADDWDNEEYTGSLADTKVFTASQGPSAPGGVGPPKQKTPPSQQQQVQQQQQPQTQPQQPHVSSGQQPPVGANSSRGSSFAASLTNGPSAGSYSQSIDLSTLLQKPTTQSSVGGSATSAAPGAQFNQQAATETLKAVVGIGQSSSGPQGDKGPMYSSYAQASAFTSINKQRGQTGGPQGPQSQAASKPASQGVVGGRSAASNRMPNTTAKIPAVEMPGDSLGRLDVSFGALDLQFGGSGSANSESMTGGFEFGSTNQTEVDKTSTSKPTSATGDVTSFAPSAKEVNKSLSNALTGAANPVQGKLNAVSNATSASSATVQQDSFSKAAAAAPIAVSNSTSATSNQPQVSVGSGSSSFGGNKQDYYNNYKGYNNYQQYQYPTSNNYTGTTTGSGGSQYKGPYDKYDTSAQLQNNPAAAVLGLASTSTTNALSGKVSATTASKVNMPNLPPGVAAAASMLHHPQYMATGLAPAFYGLQQPMYGAYGNAGFEDLAAIQRHAQTAGLHTLPTTGFYDPNNQFAAATSLGAAVAANNRDGSNNLNSLTGISTTSSAGSIGNSSSASTGFGSSSASTSANDSTNSPGPNTVTTTASGSQQNVQQQQQQQQTAFANLAATSALAQQMPPGYAYFYGNMGTALPAAAYGAATATPSHVYQPTMTVPGAGATATSQFQKTYGTSNYGTGYDSLGQQGSKDFTNSYSSNGQSKSSGGSAGAGSGKGHQYWGNTLTSAPLW